MEDGVIELPDGLTSRVPTLDDIDVITELVIRALVHALHEALDLIVGLGGGRGIRTRERVAPLHALQACPFVRSGRPPRGSLRKRRVRPRALSVVRAGGRRQDARLTTLS
jgi:hypothetical protein